MAWYVFLNGFFLLFHTAWIFFNLFGWLVPRTRPWTLVTLGLTAFSWFVLGIWYGWGYCICTHWHWQVREHLGYHDHSPTYVHLLIKMLTGWNLPTRVVENLTLAGFIIGVVGSVGLNWRDLRCKRQIAAAQAPVAERLNL